MIEKIEDILRRYGNFMNGYDGDGDEIDIDEAGEAICTLLCAEIMKVENPIVRQKDIAVSVDFAYDAFEDCRSRILSLLRSEK